MVPPTLVVKQPICVLKQLSWSEVCSAEEHDPLSFSMVHSVFLEFGEMCVRLENVCRREEHGAWQRLVPCNGAVGFDVWSTIILQNVRPIYINDYANCIPKIRVSYS